MSISIFDHINLPPLLLDLPRNPVVAVGLPIVLGTLSGFPTSKVVKGPWYQVSLSSRFVYGWYRILLYQSLRAPAGRPPNQAFGIVWPVLYACKIIERSAGKGRLSDNTATAMGYASHLAIKTFDSSLSPAVKYVPLDCDTIKT